MQLNVSILSKRIFSALDNNIAKLVTMSVLRGASTALLSVLTAFFLRGGMTEMQISIYNTLIQIVGTVISLFCSGAAAGFKDSRKPLALMLTLQALLTAGYAIFCVWHIDAGAFYTTILVIAALISIFSSIAGIFDYKQPCEVIAMEQYSVLISTSGLLSGIVGTAIGLILPMLFQRFDFFFVTGFSILLSSLCLLLAMLVNFTLKPLSKAAVTEYKPQIRINPINDLKLLLADRDFRLLLVPNFLRGIGSGVTTLTALIAIRGFQMAEGDVPLITSATTVAGFVCSSVYLFLVKRIGIPKTCLLGGILACVSCVSMLNGTVTFLLLYGIAYVGISLLGAAMPDLIYQCVDQRIISQFHTWRLALLSLGSAVSTPIYGMLLETVPAYILFVISSACFLLSVLGYYLVYRKRLGKKTAAVTE